MLRGLLYVLPENVIGPLTIENHCFQLNFESKLRIRDSYINIFKGKQIYFTKISIEIRISYVNRKKKKRKEMYLKRKKEKVRRYTHTQAYKRALSANAVVVHAYCRLGKHHPIKDIGVGLFGYSLGY